MLVLLSLFFNCSVKLVLSLFLELGQVLLVLSFHFCQFVREVLDLLFLGLVKAVSILQLLLGLLQERNAVSQLLGHDVSAVSLNL